MSPPTTLLVGGAGVAELRQALERRGRRGLTLSFPGAKEMCEPDEVADVETVDFSHPLEVMRRIVTLVRGRNLDAVVPVGEFGLLPAALAASRLGVPGPSVMAVQNTRDKLRMRRLLEQAGLGQVRYASCRTPEEGEAFLREAGGVIIVKPVSGSASDGVSLVRTPAELGAAFELASTSLGFGGVLCEEFVDGPEVSLEGYSLDGRFVPITLTDKLTDERFLETGHQQPSAQPPAVVAALADYAARALAALGVTQGVTHTEFRLGARGPVLIETHTRMGGDSIHVLTALTTGVDLADLMVGGALGEKPEVVPRLGQGGAAVRFLTGRPGRIGTIDLPARVAGDGVHAARIYVSPGHEVTGRSSSLHRLGHVIATGPDAPAAARAAEAFLGRIRITYEDPAAQPMVLLLGGADVPEFQAALARRGRHGIMLSLPEARHVFQANPVIELLDPVDLLRPLELVRRITVLQGGAGLAAVVPVMEYGLLPAAMAARQLRLPGPSLAAVQNTRDKRRMRRVLDQAGLGQLRHAACATVEAAERFLDLVAAPIIVKPASGSGSDGVSLVRRAEELPAAFELAQGALGFAGVLCEEFVEGPEVSLEGYSVAGRFVPVALTDKLTDDRFLETGHQQPSVQPPEMMAAIAEYAARALAALEVTQGVSHSEFRLSGRGPVLIETHTRMGGGSIHVLTRLTSGVDLADLMVGAALGEEAAALPQPQGRGAAIRFLTGRPGRVASIEAPPTAVGDGVHAVGIYVKPGHTVSGRSSSRDRLGHVIACGRDGQDAGRAAAAFAARIRVAYEE